MEFSLLWAALTAFIVGYIGLRIWSGDRHRHDLDDLIAAAVGGLLIGRIAAMISQGINPLSHPGELVVVRGGVSTVAASLGFLAVLGWSSRKERSRIDRVAPSVLMGLAGWHAGCLFRGACLGTPADLPWAWSLTADGVARHPVELYTALLLLAFAFLVTRLPNTLFVRAVMGLGLAALARLITEPMRPSISGGPVGWYALAAVASLGLAALIAIRGTRNLTRLEE